MKMNGSLERAVTTASCSENRMPVQEQSNSNVDDGGCRQGSRCANGKTKTLLSDTTNKTTKAKSTTSRSLSPGAVVVSGAIDNLLEFGLGQFQALVERDQRLQHPLLGYRDIIQSTSSSSQILLLAASHCTTTNSSSSSISSITTVIWHMEWSFFLGTNDTESNNVGWNDYRPYIQAIVQTLLCSCQSVQRLVLYNVQDAFPLRDEILYESMKNLLVGLPNLVSLEMHGVAFGPRSAALDGICAGLAQRKQQQQQQQRVFSSSSGCCLENIVWSPFAANPTQGLTQLADCLCQSHFTGSLHIDSRMDPTAWDAILQLLSSSSSSSSVSNSKYSNNHGDSSGCSNLTGLYVRSDMHSAAPSEAVLAALVTAMQQNTRLLSLQLHGMAQQWIVAAAFPVDLQRLLQRNRLLYDVLYWKKNIRTFATTLKIKHGQQSHQQCEGEQSPPSQPWNNHIMDLPTFEVLASRLAAMDPRVSASALFMLLERHFVGIMGTSSSK